MEGVLSSWCPSYVAMWRFRRYQRLLQDLTAPPGSPVSVKQVSNEGCWQFLTRGRHNKVSEEDSESSSPREACRCVRLEWRRNKHTANWISHSYLVACMSDGTAIRFELYEDLGYTQFDGRPRDLGRDGEVYDGLIALESDFERKPLTAVHLETVARAAGTKAYCLANRNCHHFVREVWNSIVDDPMKREHYPDRAKVHVLRSIGNPSNPVGKLILRPLEQMVACVGSAATDIQVAAASHWSTPDVVNQLPKS